MRNSFPVTKLVTQANYDRLSRWYDLLASGSEKKFTKLGLRQLNVQPGESVLEIGSGTGHALLALAAAVGGAGRVYGLDLSAGMLDVTRQRVRQAGLSARAALQQGDAVALPGASNSFDAILMSFTLELFDTPDLPVVLAECRRVLRPDGRMGVVALAKKEKIGLMVRLYEWAHRQFPHYIDCRPIWVQSALVKANFQILNVTALSMWGLPVEIVLAKKLETGQEQ
jgi:ubiquinone/menaquinone biosynthesis C-methylase UbiE